MSMIYPNAVDQRRLYNSESKTLIQNWNEERSVKKFDQIPPEFKDTDQAEIKFFKNGHRGLLTINDEAPQTKHTVYRDDYIKINNYDPNSEAKGIRYKLTEQAIREKLVQDMEKEVENDYLDEPTNYVSECMDRYSVPGFVHEPPKPTTKHDLYSEMPVSFWTDNKSRAHGVTQQKTYDTPFRRNAAFSTPITESYNKAQPGEVENYPFKYANIGSKF